MTRPFGWTAMTRMCAIGMTADASVVVESHQERADRAESVYSAGSTAQSGVTSIWFRRMVRLQEVPVTLGLQGQDRSEITCRAETR